MPELRISPFSLFHFLNFHILRQQQYGHNKYNCHAVRREDILDDLREDTPDIGFAGRGKADSDGQGECGDGYVPLAEAGFGEHLDSADEDASEHHQGTAAQHGFRKAGEKVSDRRKKSREDHEYSAGHDGETVDNFRHVDQSDVLTERGQRRAAEQRRDKAGETVAGKGAGDFPFGDLTVQAAGYNGSRPMIVATI